ncbi:unnamed protein product [Linum trigynum]|uniref:Uncharacterized protein n=1 Tax=Linum trigynum TaxID=586398 RepID=A0AAV2D212_9ROSI
MRCTNLQSTPHQSSICTAIRIIEYYDYEQRERVCAGIGYMDRKFFCLFDTGDVMIFGIGGGSGGGERTMLLATPQLRPGQLGTRDSLRVVLWSKSTRREESLVVSWVRRGGDHHHGGGRGSSSFRLSIVKRKRELQDVHI